MRRVRGARIAMVFQEPMTSLNPVFSIGDQIASAVRAHGGGGRREAWERTEAMLDLVQIPSPRQRARDYPHQLSGGLRQRAMIAMALALGAGAADRRRADHGARRHHPGADPRSAAPAPGGAGHGGAPDHARPRRRRRALPPRCGHLWWAHRRARAGAKSLRAADPSVHARAAPVPAASEPIRAAARSPSRACRPISARRGAGCRFAPRCAYAIASCRRDEPALEEREPGHFVACPVVA